MKALFRSYTLRFFSDNSSFPVFVPLHPDITLRVAELQEDMKELAEADTDEQIPPPPPPHSSESAGEAASKHPHPDIKEERPAKRLAVPVVPAPALPHFLGIMDDGIEAEEKKEEGEHDVQWEIDNWFSPAAPRLRFADNPPEVTWPSLAPTFPRLALLARRFLCILPTSAPSERVWSGFGHVITKESSNIDSEFAIRNMFLRYNPDLIDSVPL